MEQQTFSIEKPLKEIVNIYIENLNVYEKVAYEIAKKNLESSFDIEKSIGFLDFMQENNYTILPTK
tara:strand:+ start:1098 stop:1295 length:198 start_codon:yes stop_codon:yes gene_type:complete